jgi:hypothetical protein
MGRVRPLHLPSRLGGRRVPGRLRATEYVSQGVGARGSEASLSARGRTARNARARTRRALQHGSPTSKKARPWPSQQAKASTRRGRCRAPNNEAPSAGIHSEPQRRRNGARGRSAAVRG